MYCCGIEMAATGFLLSVQRRRRKKNEMRVINQRQCVKVEGLLSVGANK